MNFSGENVVITGSSRGIGAACARKFAEQGANLMLNYYSDDSQARVEELIDEFENLENSGRIISRQADVSDSEEAEDLIKTSLNEFESIDILINNAGITRDGLFMRMKEEDWRDVIDVNLNGVYNCTHAAIRSMIKNRSGSIINMTSIVAMIGNPGQSNYAASKAGIIGFTRSLAREVASRNININAVAPGFIKTDMTDDMPESAREEMLSNIPLAREGKPEEVADTVLFLSSDLAQYITGEVIKVTGGLGI
ncbi:3-oxoacyl-[acyl-carrier-protein] reductase [Halarsenatibacter silvermanii]|uniref:3-oxoacyl-[acyl-carrier-protein] reductase n=1 Tax=Halarsenatibacter silvermanii TaxID=321763 RepID=A0A1G9NT98_9FIRM|nr:3-oxoacyl-[acyl-carrier-protein] reductase [Halarsenatibacter silvermanii]SDL89792.1 3-oxoacyl-[acyl-carrier-protein] reductase [Halarsenatibacter silvermanii]